eukprot:m.50395 g.50395  ORF g.50395 m.50395 type:complete len:1028 (-) comp11159_c0_seq3:266-3349(-)
MATASRGGDGDTDRAGMLNESTPTDMFDPTYQLEYQMGRTHVLALNQSPTALAARLKTAPDGVFEVDLAQRTPLILAAFADDDKSVQALLAGGADIHHQDLDGRTAAHWASYHGRTKALAALLSGGCDVTLKDNAGRTALHWATGHKQTKSLETLIKSMKATGDSLDQQDEEQMSALHWACFHNHSKHAVALLSAGANGSLRDVDGKTPLHWTSDNPTGATAKAVILKQSSLANDRDAEGRTILHLAVGVHNVDLIQTLLKISAVDVDAQDDAQRTPLHWAISLQQEDTVTMLMTKRKPDMALKDVNGVSCVHYTAQLHDDRFAKVLASKGPSKSLNVVDGNSRTPLMWALAEDHLETALVFVDAGCDLTIQDVDGRTALHLAMSKNMPNFVAVFLEKKPKNKNGISLVDIADNNGHTALMLTCQTAQAHATSQLLEYGVLVDAVDTDQRNALHFCAMGGAAECATLVIERTPQEQLNVGDERGETALHYSAYFNNPKVAQLLLAAGAEYNIRDNDGVTPLHWAASAGSSEAMRLLLNYNAYPNFMDESEDRLTPLDYAAAEGHEECIQILREYGGMISMEVQQLAAARIMGGFKMMKARKMLILLKQEKVEKDTAAAIRIQANVRGMLARKQLKSIRQKTEEEQKAAFEAAEQKKKEKEEEEKRKRAEEEAAAEAKKSEEERKRDAEKRVEEERRAKLAVKAEEKRRLKREEEEKKKEEEERMKEQRLQQALQRKQEQEAQKQEEEERMRLRTHASVGNLATDERTSVLAKQQVRMHLVKKERDRVSELRRVMQAASVIQRWWRYTRHTRYTSLPPMNATDRLSLESQRQREAAERSHRLQQKAISKTQSLDPVAEAPSPTAINATPSSERERLVAVLTIQLWWRKHLANKHSSRYLRFKSKTQGPRAANRKQATRLGQVYLRNPAPKPQKLKPFKPMPPRALVSHFQYQGPSAAELSWSSAAGMYFAKPKPDRKPRAFPRRAPTSTSLKSQLRLPLIQSPTRQQRDTQRFPKERQPLPQLSTLHV